MNHENGEEEQLATLDTTFCGVKLISPVVVGSANITGNFENIKRCQDNGAGAVVMKSLFEKEVCREAPTPRFAIIRRGSGEKRSFILYSYEQASVWGPDRYAREVERCRNGLSIPVIASINCYTPEGWASYAKRMEAAGASVLELNVSCPHGSVTFSGVKVEETIFDVARIVRSEVKIPIVVKLSAQLTAPLNVVHELEQLGCNGVTLFNRFTGLEIDIEREIPIMHGSYAGHGGPWAIHLGLRWISAIRPHVALDISASGGVDSPEDVIKYLLVGANTVQTCTSVIMNGYEVVRKFNEGLLKFMEGKGYRTIDEFRGKINARILSTEEVDRRHLYRARINKSRCNNCGRCKSVCTYSAIEEGIETHEINDRCDGCGLCKEICPRGAVDLISLATSL